MNKLIRTGLKGPACLLSLRSFLTGKEAGGASILTHEAESGVNWFNPPPILLSSAMCVGQKPQELQVLQGGPLPSAWKEGQVPSGPLLVTCKTEHRISWEMGY